MKIGILLAGRSPENIVQKYGEYDALFHRLFAGEGFEFTTYNVVDNQFPIDIHTQEAWLITGSRHGVYDDLPFIAPLMAFIQQVYEAKIPLVGICFGHQIIAKALGGQVEKFQKGWSAGDTIYQLPSGEIHIVSWHQDQVIAPPKEAKTLGGNDFCEHAFLLYPQNVFTMQPHPEFDEAFMKDLFLARGAVLPDDIQEKIRAQAHLTLDSAQLAQDIARFFRGEDMQLFSDK